ncbi:MAG: amidohydrolase [Phenylobacterium sp.]|nr:amidohydrolase [Phenylobacterium sp.]
MADDATKLANAQDARRYWLDGGNAPGGEIRKVDYAKERGGVHPLFQGIKIVDTDTHFTEPPDLFTSRAPARFKDKVPYVRNVDGVDRWVCQGRDFGSVGGNVIGKDNNKLLGRLAFQTLAEGHPGSHLVQPRLQAMDDMGIYAQVCYQNAGVTQAGSLIALEDDDLAVSILQMYNDAAAERQAESGQRIFTLAHLPIWNKAALEAEARRCLDMQIKGFVLPDVPERYGLPGFLDAYWAPFLEMCEATGTPINFHLNSAVDPSALVWRNMGFERNLAVGSIMMFLGNAATLGNWMVSGALDVYPKLKIGLIESGAGWIPFMLEALEHQFDEMLPKGAVAKRPWEYFKQNFWCTYWFETIGPRDLLETIGVDKVMFETDFPHPTSLYPGVQAHLAKTLGGHSYEVRKQVLEGNPVALYNLPF